jgi:hypothetical protein
MVSPGLTETYQNAHFPAMYIWYLNYFKVVKLQDVINSILGIWQHLVSYLQKDNLYNHTLLSDLKKIDNKR